jgi:sugar lactone lactonase YvrE
MSGLALSPDERTLYVADYLNHAIRAIDLLR